MNADRSQEAEKRTGRGKRKVTNVSQTAEVKYGYGIWFPDSNHGTPTIPHADPCHSEAKSRGCRTRACRRIMGISRGYMVLRCNSAKPSACESRSRTRLPGKSITIEVVVADSEDADNNERLQEN